MVAWCVCCRLLRQIKYEMYVLKNLSQLPLNELVPLVVSKRFYSMVAAVKLLYISTCCYVVVVTHAKAPVSGENQRCAESLRNSLIHATTKRLKLIKYTNLKLKTHPHSTSS